MMKKYLFSFAVLMMGATLLTACSDDDDDKKSDPVYVPVDVSNGIFVVGSGNTKAGIGGNLTYVDYAKGTATQNAFESVNGKALGQTANKALVYGQKLYIVVDKEATIWVCDKNTLKVQKQISTTGLLGETEGVSPRSVVGSGDNIYFTTYGGVVASVDAVSFNLVKKYQAGSYPDGLVVVGNYIYTANSDYGMCMNPSISKIDITTGTTTEIKDEVITNPMHMLAVGSDVYYLDYGTYDTNWNQTGAGVRKITAAGKVSKVVDGTAMCTDGKKIYTVNAPYGGSGIQYYIYDIATGATTTWEPADVFSPACIAADPVSGDIFVVSYQKNPDTGYAGYALPSYMNQYKANGTFVTKYNCVVGPIDVVFNTGVEYVEQK